MKQNMPSAITGFCIILLIWGLSFFSFPELRDSAQSWILGKSYNGFIISGFISLFFLLMLFVYFLTGGERLNHASPKKWENHQAFDFKPNLGFTAQPNMIAGLSQVEETEYNKFNQQMAGPSLFQSEIWKANLAQKLPDYFSVDTKEDKTDESLNSHKSNRFEILEVDSLYMLDLEELSNGKENPELKRLTEHKNSLNKDLDLLLSEQGKIFENTESTNPTEDTENLPFENQTTNKSGSNKLGNNSSRPQMKVVHISSI